MKYSSEKEIIRGCIRKERKAQEVLYKKYYRTMLGLCLRYSKDKAEAEDVMLDGLTRIFLKISKYDGRGSFEGWMKKIMINTAIDNYRKNLKHYYHEHIDDVDEEYMASSKIPDNLSRDQIMSTLQQLPPGSRMIFNLYAIEGFSHKEIAGKLDISANTSKTQLLKARKTLQKKLIQLNTITYNTSQNE